LKKEEEIYLISLIKPATTKYLQAKEKCVRLRHKRYYKVNDREFVVPMN